MDALDSTAGIIALGAAAVALLAFALAGFALSRLRGLRAGQRAVLGETGAGDLVDHGLQTRERVEELAASIERIAATLEGRIEQAERRLDGSISRSGVLRYDAFNESTGHQSSSIALIDDRGNGVVVSAITQREQARVYAKPIRSGESELELSPEEREVLRIAEQSSSQ